MTLKAWPKADGDAMARMVVPPFPTAVANPLELTVATSSAELVQVRATPCISRLSWSSTVALN